MASDELRFINAIIGFCTLRGGTWPAPLAPYGYVACAVEREVRMILHQEDRTVVIDLICASALTHHALCVEVKSGTLHADQAQRYAALTSTNLLDMGRLPPTVEPTALTHDVMYVADRIKTGRLIEQFQHIQIVMPLVAGDNNAFELVHGAFRQHDVHRIFDHGIALDEQAWPTGFVPFKSDSPLADLVPPIIGAVARFVLDGEDFTIEQLAERSVRHWALCGGRERSKVRERIAHLADLAMREELKGYYERPGKPQAWTVSGGRLAIHAQADKLSRLAGAFVERVQKGAEFRPDQLSFGDEFYEALRIVDEEDEDDNDME